MNTRLIIAHVLGAVVALPASAQAQIYDPLTVPADGKWDLGWELEKRFTTYMSSCGALPMKMTKTLKPAKTVSSIDSKLIEALGLRSGVMVEKPLGVGLGRFFGYIYPEAEKDNPLWLTKNFLQVRYDNDSSFITSFGFPSTHYTASCGSVFAAALTGGGGYSFSVVATKAAFEAEIKTDNRSTLELSDGVFESPISAMWSSGSLNAKRSQQKFYIAMMFWSWYNSSLRTGKYAILTTFNGTSFHRQLTSRKNEGGAGSMEVSSSIPFVTANAKVEGKSDSNRTLEVRDFEVFVDKQESGAPPVRQWMDMPTLDDILHVIQDFADVSQPRLDSPFPISSGQTRNITVDIEGLPYSYCDKVPWDIRDSLTASEASKVLSILSASRVQEPGSTMCRFTLSYKAGLIATGGDVVLNSALISKDAQGGKRATIPLKQLSLPTTTSPSLTWTGGKPRAEIVKISGSNPVQYDLVWTVDIKLVDNGKFANINQIKTGELGLKCKANTLSLGDAIFEGAFVGVPGPDSRNLRLTGRAKFEGGEISSDYAFEACTLDGPITFEASGSAPLSRQASQMNVMLYYPTRTISSP